MKNTENYAKVRFKATSINEGFARICASAFASQCDPTIEVLNDVKTAVSEAVTNAIVHAYPDTLGDVEMAMSLNEEGVLTLFIRDEGKGIENIERAMQPFYTTLADEERSGMGFTVMQTFMDMVEVTSKVGGGTTVVMKKVLTGKKK